MRGKQPCKPSRVYSSSIDAVCSRLDVEARESQIACCHNSLHASPGRLSLSISQRTHLTRLRSKIDNSIETNTCGYLLTPRISHLVCRPVGRRLTGIRSRNKRV